MSISQFNDITTLSRVHVDQLIEQVRSVLSEEEKELFSQEMVIVDYEHKQEIDSIELTTLQI